jgi:hypothetical protein
MNAVLELRDFNGVCIVGEVHILEDLSSDPVYSSQCGNNLLIVITVCVLKLSELKVSGFYVCDRVILVCLNLILKVEGNDH